MTNLRLLLKEKVKIKKDTDSSKREPNIYWIIRENPITKDRDPVRISTSAFNAEDFGSSSCLIESLEGVVLGDRTIEELFFSNEHFFRFNNDFVKASIIAGYSPGALYDSFLDEGFRACQQLSERLRLRTVIKYRGIEEELKKNLLLYHITKTTETRDNNLNEILRICNNINQEDYKVLCKNIQTLKGRKIEYEESNIYGQSFLERITDRLLQEDNSKEWLESLRQIDDSFKYDFFKIITNYSLNGGKFDFTSEHIPKFLADVTKKLDNDNIVFYLKSIQRTQEKDDHDDFLTLTYNAFELYIRNFDDEKKELYFDVINQCFKRKITTAHNDNDPAISVYISLKAVELLEKKSKVEIKAILDDEFKKHSSNEGDKLYDSLSSYG